MSGLWMTAFYARPHDVGDLLTGFRLEFASAWIACLVLGFAAIRRRDITRHRAWMICGYAVGMGAVTQGLTQLPWIVAFGTLDQLSKGAADARWLGDQHRGGRVGHPQAPRAPSFPITDSRNGRRAR